MRVAHEIAHLLGETTAESKMIVSHLAKLLEEEGSKVRQIVEFSWISLNKAGEELCGDSVIIRTKPRFFRGCAFRWSGQRR